MERLRKDFNSKLIPYYKDSSVSNFCSDQEVDFNMNLVKQEDKKSEETQADKNQSSNFEIEMELNLKSAYSKNKSDVDENLEETETTLRHENEKPASLSLNSEPSINNEYKSSKTHLLNTVIIEEESDEFDESNNEQETLMDHGDLLRSSANNKYNPNRLSQYSSNGSSADLSDITGKASSNYVKDDLVEKFCTKHYDKIKLYIANLLESMPLPEMPENESDFSFNQFSLINNNNNSFTATNNNLFNGRLIKF
jgi:hypothetical protein